jgi:hypothetical protein
MVSDGRFAQKMSAYVARPMASEEVRAAASSALALAARLDGSVSRFLRLALEEEEPLKRFLYFFLSVEIATHLTFRKLGHSDRMFHAVNTQTRLRVEATWFADANGRKWKNLQDRFVWCALCTWTQLSGTDVDDFGRLKKIRNDIAHGNLAIPPADSVTAVEKLAVRLCGFNM